MSKADAMVGSQDDGRRWLGFPRTVTAADAQLTLEFLSRLWANQQKVPMGGIDEDLDRLYTWFNPISTGNRIRRQLSELLPSPGRPELLSPPHVYVIEGDTQLLTPEGRWLHELLRRAAAGRTESVSLTVAAMAEAEASLVDTYRRWCFQRLDGVVGMQRGEAAPLLPASLGQVLLLLTNGSIGPGRALRLPDSEQGRHAVDDALTRIVEAFANRLAPSADKRGRDRKHFSLYSGYALSEASRRLGGRLVKDKAGTYLSSGSESEVVDRLAQELVRRPAIQRQNTAAALDALVDAYEEARPVLAAWSVAYAEPSRPAAVRERVLAAVNGLGG